MRTLLFIAVASATLAAAPVPKDFEPTFADRYGAANPIGKNCRVVSKRNKLDIAITSGSLYGFDEGGNLLMPHVAKEVAGDFTLTVWIEPGELPEHGRFEKAHYETGVYLRSGADVSFQLAVQHRRSHVQCQTVGVYSIRKPGSGVSGCDDSHFDRPCVHTRMERKGELVTVAVLTVKGQWEVVKAERLPLKKSVQVGLYVSSSGKPFGATFSDYDVKAK